MCIESKAIGRIRLIVRLLHTTCGTPFIQEIPTRTPFCASLHDCVNDRPTNVLMAFKPKRIAPHPSRREVTHRRVHVRGTGPDVRFMAALAR